MPRSNPVILVTGASGLLGPYLMESASKRGRAVAMARHGGDHPCDLVDEESVRTMIDDIQPDIVLHAAAMTDVDICERDAKAADRANRLATRVLARSLPLSTLLVAFSTIAVYPNSAGPHVEGSEAPVNVYGKTKLAGEQEALQHAQTVVLRTSLFGPSRSANRQSISDFVISNLTRGKPIKLFDDALFSPLHLKNLAEITLEIAMVGLRGVYNVASREGMSKYDFGMAVAKKVGLATDAVSRVHSTDIPGRAPRAIDSRLDVTLLEKSLGRRMPTLKEEIARL